MINTRLLRSLVLAFALCPLAVSALSPIFPNVLREKLLELDFEYVDTYLNEAPDESSGRHRDVLGELALLTSETWYGEISDAVATELIKLRDAMLDGDALGELVEEDYVELVRIAVQADNVFVIQFLLDRYSSFSSTPPTEGLAEPFHETLGEHIRFIPLFVEAGVDLNRQVKGAWPLALLLKYSIQRPRRAFPQEEHDSYIGTYGSAEERADMFWRMVNLGADAGIPIANGDSIFADAALVGDLRILDYLLSRGAAIDARTYNDETALMIAAYKGNNYIDTISWLLAHGADICAESGDGATAYDAALGSREVAVARRFPELLCSSKVNVAWAGYSGDTDIIEHLLANGGGVNDMTSNGLTALMTAAGFGDNPEQALPLLLAHGADACLESDASYGGSTAADLALQQSRPELLLSVPGLLCRESMKFHLSGIAGNVDVMAYLLEQGADINSEDQNLRTLGQSALLNAISSSNAREAVPWLLRNGANPCAREWRGGRTAYEIALERAKPDSGLRLREEELAIARELLRNPDLLCPSETRLYEAVPLGDIELIDFMLQRGVSIDATGSYGWTSLMRAVLTSEHRMTLVPFLVERGADRCVRDADGRTAYDLAVGAFRSDEELALLPRLRCEEAELPAE
ncbi:MAG: ankyrin repeat domain-containing protein [Pseudomonadota bacterium]|nr:ankyrin repeat domain-containing protein [Pseudomonadota bacterium]